MVVLCVRFGGQKLLISGEFFYSPQKSLPGHLSSATLTTVPHSPSRKDHVSPLRLVNRMQTVPTAAYPR